MPIRVVRLGSPRAAGEGPRIGTVRRPPRGVPRAQYASRDYYDVWLPELAPSPALVSAAQRGLDERGRRRFEKAYRAEMGRKEAARLMDLLAALSHRADFSVGCYCEAEERCHRSILKQLLREHGASLADPQADPPGRVGGRRRDAPARRADPGARRRRRRRSG